MPTAEEPRKTIRFSQAEHDKIAGIVAGANAAGVPISFNELVRRAAVHFAEEALRLGPPARRAPRRKLEVESSSEGVASESRPSRAKDSVSIPAAPSGGDLTDQEIAGQLRMPTALITRLRNQGRIKVERGVVLYDGKAQA